MTVAQSPAEALTRDAYLALMWSLSYPGRAHQLPLPLRERAGVREETRHIDFLVIARTLLDLETSFFCIDDMLSAQLAETDARQKPIEDAAYIFLPTLDAQTSPLIERASLGTFAYPDKGATIITRATFDAGAVTTWSGPGIPSPRRVMLDVPHAFWQLRANRIHYPLGFDVFFVDHDRVIGLPRTTEVH